MSEAEDTDFDKEVLQEKAREAWKIIELILPLVPLVVENLKDQNYPECSYSTRRTVVVANGVRRFGWVVLRSSERDRVTYILSDGRFVSGECASVLNVVRVIKLTTEDRPTELTEILESLRILGGYGKSRELKDSRLYIREDERYPYYPPDNVKPRQNRWRQFLNWLNEP